jgi:hypothetical protein
MKPLKSIALMLSLIASAFAGQESLVGRWESKDGKERLEFTQNGRVTSIASGIGISGRYECPAENIVRLKFEGDGAPPPINFTYTADEKLLSLKSTEDKILKEFIRWKKKS